MGYTSMIFGYAIFSILSATIGAIAGTVTGIWLASTYKEKRWAIRVKSGGR